jgi:hypothetical protein
MMDIVVVRPWCPSPPASARCHGERPGFGWGWGWFSLCFEIQQIDPIDYTVIYGILTLSSDIIPYNSYNYSYLVGGIPTPLKNMKVGWDDEIPNVWKNKNIFQTTNQNRSNRLYSYRKFRYIIGLQDIEVI